MNKQWYIIGSILAVVIAIGAFLMFSSNDEEMTKVADNNAKTTRVKSSKANSPRKSTRLKKQQQDRQKALAKTAKEVRVKPRMFTFEETEEEKELTDLAKKVLGLLQAALDSENYAQIRSAQEVIANAPKGSLSKVKSGIPVAIRKKLVEAMGWFGATAIPEMVEFLADPNPEVAQMTIDQFELALQDVTLGDRDRAKIVALASTVLTDHDALEQMFMEISNMRNSVAADTLYTICKDGTDMAKSMMPETIEFVTGEDNIVTDKDLLRWKDQNPDDPYDDDLYGPMETE